MSLSVGSRGACAALLMGLAAAAASSAGARPVISRVVPAVVAGRQAAYLGRADDAQAMQVSVSLPMRNTAQLDALLKALYDPASPQYRRYLSVADYTARFGPTASDYRAAAAYFARQGLKVRADAANRALIQLSGSVADMNRVFHVRISRFRHPTEERTFMAPDVEPTVDAGVAIQEVIGLDDYILPTPRLVRPMAEAATAARTTGSGPGGKFLGSDMRAAYYGAGPLTGAGQTLGLMELVGYNVASVQAYFDKVGEPLSVPVVTVATDSVKVDCLGKCDDGEQALDIEYAISMAPGLDALEVYVGNPEDVLNSMASRNTAKALSTSWGWGERFATDDALFKEMAAQGQTFLTASGDYSSLRASGPWPEEDANLTAVGGTDLVTAKAGGAWKSETGWKYSAGGPSLDKTILIEPYQSPYVNAQNEASSTVRNVPDIAAQSNINMYYCYNRGCDYAGGTSFASPMWAGFVALANEQAATAGGRPVGFLNPTLYRLGLQARAAKVFHDITQGVSGKYGSTKSFDLVTGLGSMQPGLIPNLAK